MKQNTEHPARLRYLHLRTALIRSRIPSRETSAARSGGRFQRRAGRFSWPLRYGRTAGSESYRHGQSGFARSSGHFGAETIGASRPD